MKPTILNWRSFLHGSRCDDISHKFGQPLRVQEVDVFQSMVLKMKQCTCGEKVADPGFIEWGEGGAHNWCNKVHANF